MSRILLPTIAATCVAFYFISRKRKVEIEVEIEPVDDMSGMESNIAEIALAAD